MQILSLGLPLPDAQIDNYDWASALSFYDYDAIIVDPSAVSRFIEGVVQRGESYLTYTDEPVTAGPSGGDTVSVVQLLRRRQDEVAKLLARGGTVVVFAYPDVAHPDVAGFSGCHRYYWLPAPPGADYGTKYLQPASGVHVQATDYENPFADYFERMRNDVLYRASITEGAAGFGEASKVLARSPGGACISMELSVGGGRIVFVPALPPRASDSNRSAAAHSLVTAIRNSLLLQAEEQSPEWLDRYPLPGILDLQGKMEAADSQLDAAQAEADQARNEYRSIDRFRRLLWQEGKYGFDLPVRDTLSRLGMINFASTDEPASFLFDGEHVLMECQSSIGQVGMEPHYRLRQRLEQRIAHEGRRVHGLIVVNGYRNTPPLEREQQYDGSLRVAAESMRYCVVEAYRLFEAVSAQMQGKNEHEAFLKRLVQTEGVYDPNSVPTANEA